MKFYTTISFDYRCFTNGWSKGYCSLYRYV